MGIVHKLKPEIIKFILENKQKDPSLSCRTLTQLVFDKFQIKVSKSSANAIFKENNLSMPIGRRQKNKKRKFNMPVLPVIEEETRAVTLVTQTKEVEPVISPEEKRIKEAEEWAMKLHKEDKDKAEERLKIEKQIAKNEDTNKKAEEAELRFLMEEAAKVNAQKDAKKAEEDVKKAEEEKSAQEAKLRAEQERLAKLADEETKKAEEEKAAQEAALKAEKEKWAKLAEVELKTKQQGVEKEATGEKVDFIDVEKLTPSQVYSGVILLKAVDSLIGGSREINEVICKELGSVPDDSLNLTEALIFRSLFGKDNMNMFWSLIGSQYSQEKLDNYYEQINQIQNIKLATTKIISDVFTEARGVGIHFSDGSTINLDAQLHSSWSGQNIPYDFSSSIYELKNNLNKYFFQGQPLVLFSAPGYDMPSKDFFNLLSNISSTVKGPDTLTLFGNKLEEIESISLSSENKYTLVFGLWPWQFTSSRKVKRIGDFDLKHIEKINQDLYLAEIEIDLLRASLNQKITFKGCAVKTSPTEKIRLVILNSEEQSMSLDKLAEAYLSRWPNFEEAFHDFSRKIELFSYVSNTQKFFSKDNFGAEKIEPTSELEKIFANYIKILDAYLRWHFLPSGYTEKDFSYTSECFYKLPVKLAASQGIVSVNIQVDKEYQLIKDLEYLLRRLNERQIDLIDGERLYLKTFSNSE